MSPVRAICCIGAGYVGGPTSAVIAAKNPNIAVTVVDVSTSRIAGWQTATTDSTLPIYEPGLSTVVTAARDCVDGRSRPNLFFSTDIDSAIKKADIVFVAVHTPTKSNGAGAGKCAELAFFEHAVRRIASVVEKDTIVVEKSTVPVGTGASVREIVDLVGPAGVTISILSNPEFLAEGTAIADLLCPDRVLIGAEAGESGSAAAATLAGVYAAWVPVDRIVTVSLASAELAKLAANALLAQRISTVNALSAVCETVGADVEQVVAACGMDSRIGNKMLKPSVGFGGSCFRKDVLALAHVAESAHLSAVASYFTAVVDINEHQKDRFGRRIVRCLYGSLSRKKIALLGFAYKKDTADTRDSAAIAISRAMLVEGAHVSVYDPRVKPAQIEADVAAALACATVGTGISINPASPSPSSIGTLTVAESGLEACAGAYAVVIATEWDEFSNRGPATGSGPGRLDWQAVAAVMHQPMVVFDGRNVVDHSKLHQLGFRVESIGKAGVAAAVRRAVMGDQVTPTRQTGLATPVSLASLASPTSSESTGPSSPVSFDSAGSDAPAKWVSVEKSRETVDSQDE